MVDVCKIGVRALHGLREIIQMISWKVPAGICHVQMFLSHFLLFLLNTFLDPSVLEKGYQTPLNQALSAWRASFHQLRVEILVGVECGDIGVTLGESAILHFDGRKVYLERDWWAREASWDILRLPCI